MSCKNIKFPNGSVLKFTIEKGMEVWRSPAPSSKAMMLSTSLEAQLYVWSRWGPVGHTFCSVAHFFANQTCSALASAVWIFLLAWWSSVYSALVWEMTVHWCRSASTDPLFFQFGTTNLPHSEMSSSITKTSQESGVFRSKLSLYITPKTAQKESGEYLYGLIPWILTYYQKSPCGITALGFQLTLHPTIPLQRTVEGQGTD